MMKKNIFGIVIVSLIAAAFVGGYFVGRGAAPSMPASRMGGPPGGGAAGGSPPPAGNEASSPPADQEGDTSPTEASSEDADSRKPPAAGTEHEQSPVAAEDGSAGPEAALTDEMRAAVAKARAEGKSREEIQALIAKLRAQNADASSAGPTAGQPVAPDLPGNQLEFYGTAAPAAEVNVQSRQGGTLVVLNGKEGDFVQQGDVLAQFDDSEQQLNLEKARSARNSAAQQVRQAESSLNAAETNLERNQQLFDEGLLSQQQLDDLRNKVDSAKSSLSSARESLKQADTQIELLENTLKNFTVYAPISGIINQKSYNVQEVYGGGGVLYQIVNIDDLYVNVDVPETYIKRMQEGLPVTIRFNALREQTFPGVLETVLPSGASSNRTFTVKVRMRNPDHVVKPGMFATVHMALPEG